MVTFHAFSLDVPASPLLSGMFIHWVIWVGFKAGANVCIFTRSLLVTPLIQLCPRRVIEESDIKQSMYLDKKVYVCTGLGVLTSSFLSPFSSYAHRSPCCRRMSTSRGWELTCEALTCWGRCPGCTNSPCSARIHARSSSSQMDLLATWLKCWSWFAITHVLAGTEKKGPITHLT